MQEDNGYIPQEDLAVISASLPDYFEKHLNKDIFVFLCKDNEKAIACCFLYVSEKPANLQFPSGRTATVLNVLTQRAHRRKGIATRLLKMLLKCAETLGCDYVELKATDEGRLLYRSLGFEEPVSKYHNMKYTINKITEK